MNRKQFIESKGATCSNWTWSWSFINEKEKVIIFGAWDHHSENEGTVILGEDWEYNRHNGRRNNGYSQSREHLRLVESGEYKLMTYPIFLADKNDQQENKGPSRIGRFKPILTQKSLRKIGKNWYAAPYIEDSTLPEEVDDSTSYVEGATKSITINAYERNKQARAACIAHYKPVCIVCRFDFFKKYGEIGKNLIHVHHLIPLSSIGKSYELDPIKDLRPVCPNCHAVIHHKNKLLPIEEVQEHIRLNKDAD